MGKNAKIVIFTIIFIALCLCLSMCSDQIGKSVANAISGENGKCDYCGEEADIVEGTKEYCGPCFQEYDGNIWS